MTGLHETALIERERELAVVDDAVAAVASGESRLVMIEGTAGIGKTRLLGELRERARAAGFLDLSSTASELSRSLAFGALRELFAAHLCRLGDDDRRRLLCGQAQLAAPPLGLEEGRAAARTEADALFAAFNGIYWLCVALAEERPLLLAIDDAHWCDETSLRWLSFAVPRLESVPIFVALASRVAEPGTDAPATIAELARRGPAEVLSPRALSREAVGELARRALGEPEGEFASACWEASGGNPYLLHELLVEASSAGIAPTASAGSRVAELGSRRVSEAVLGRARRLGPEALRLTAALAVLGDRSRLAHAAALAELGEEEAAAAAAALVDAQILAEGFPLSFLHPLVRAATYESLPYAQRLFRHERAAHVLDRAGEPAERVAAHLLLARPRGEEWTLGVLRRAAAESSARGSALEPVAYLRRALAEPPPDSELAAVLAELGIAEHDCEDPAAVDRLRTAVGAAGEPAARARIGLVLARATWQMGRIADAVELLSSLLGGLDSAELAAPLEAELVAIARLDSQTRAVGLEVFSHRGAERVGEADPGGRLLLANLCFERAVSAERPAADVIDLGRRALAGGALLREVGSENTVYHLAAWALAQCGRYAEAEAAVEEAIALAREEGSVAGFARAVTFRCNFNFRRGRLEEAEADGREALDHLTPVRGPLASAFLLDVLLERDDLEAAEDLLARFELCGELPGSILHTLVLERRGRLRLAQGDREAALFDLRTVRERANAWGAGSPAFLPWRSGLALALGAEDPEAAELAAEEIEVARRFGAPRALGVALRTQGVLSDRPADVELLEEAVAVLDGCGAPLEHARTLVDLGAALRRAGKRSRSRRPLREGLAEAERRGARALARRARGELRSAGGRAVRFDQSGLEALTASERRVARMAAEGMSNREIAETLFVIPKTVEWHLAGTYRKLGLHRRTELPAALGSVRGPEKAGKVG